MRCMDNKPYIIVKHRLSKNPIPNWDISILCFQCKL